MPVDPSFFSTEQQQDFIARTLPVAPYNPTPVVTKTIQVPTPVVVKQASVLPIKFPWETPDGEGFNFDFGGFSMSNGVSNLFSGPSVSPLNPLSGVSSLFSGNWLAYGLLAYGGYQVVIKRRKNLTSFAALASGLYMSGLLNYLLPRDSSGNVDVGTTALMALAPRGTQTLAAAAGPLGLAAVAVPAIMSLLKSRRNTRRIRRMSYSRPRRRWYGRRY